MKLDQTTMNKIENISDPTKRYDFVFLVDIKDGNPNGDPDFDNRPRIDEETGEGLITDVCIKRKIRDYIDNKNQIDGNQRGREIYVLNRGEFLEQVNDNLVKECEKDQDFLNNYKMAYGTPYSAKNKLKPDVLTKYACAKYYDWRCFGAVPGKPIENATVRGPIQISFGRSIGRISWIEHGISRVVQNKSSGDKQGENVHGTFGTKYTVSYGLYVFSGHYSAFLAERTGFNNDDLKLFWEAMICWPCIDSSATRNSMGVRGLYVFKHDYKFGNAPAHELFDRVKVSLRDGVETPRSFEDYVIQVDDQNLPEDVSLTRVVG